MLKQKVYCSHTHVSTCLAMAAQQDLLGKGYIIAPGKEGS